MSVKPIFEVMRPPNSVISGLGAVFAVLVYLDYNVTVDHTILLLVAFTTGFSLTACSMIINDIVDVEVDRVNKPWKPLPRGAITARRAAVIATLLGALGVLVNITTQNTLLVLTALLYCTMGVSYNYMRKYWWSHTLVAASTTGPVVYGYIAANMPLSKLKLAAVFSIIVFTATTGREILKSIQDYRGDAEKGYSTIATKYGVNTALKTMLATSLLASTLAVISTIILETGIAYKTLILITVVIYTYSLLRAYKQPEPRILEQARKKTLLAMSTGLLAFWLSGL